jgi:hypothetical protein
LGKRHHFSRERRRLYRPSADPISRGVGTSRSSAFVFGGARDIGDPPFCRVVLAAGRGVLMTAPNRSFDGPALTSIFWLRRSRQNKKPHENPESRRQLGADRDIHSHRSEDATDEKQPRFFSAITYTNGPKL